MRNQKMTTYTKKKGSVTVNGMTITWNDTRHMVHSEPDDLEMRGEYQVTISTDHMDIDKAGHALHCARKLRHMGKTYGSLLCPVPDSPTRMELEGIDDMGSVILRIYAGDRKCDASPVSQLSFIDPANYSQAGTVAQASVAWMRDVATAIRDWDGSEQASEKIRKAVVGQ